MRPTGRHPGSQRLEVRHTNPRLQVCAFTSGSPPLKREGMGERVVQRQHSPRTGYHRRLACFLTQISPLQEKFRSATISGRLAKKRILIGATRHNIHRIPPGYRVRITNGGESVASREFTVTDEYVYNRSGPVRWVISHVLRYKRFLSSAVGAMIVANVLLAAIPRLTGTAFNEVLRARPDESRLALVALGILACVLAGGVFDAAARFSSEILAQRLERDARDELYLSLLGKSQTFHNRQRVGDIMARATNDVRQLNPTDRTRPRPASSTRCSALVIADHLHRLSQRRNCCWRRCSSPSASSSRCATTSRRAQPGLRRDARAVRRAERRAGRDDHRHRGGQVHRAGGAGAAQVRAERARLPRLLRPATGRFRRATCRRCCWRSRWSAPSCTASICCTQGQLDGRRAGRLHGADGHAALPDVHLDLHLLAGAAGHRRRRAHPGAACARRPNWTRTKAGYRGEMRGEIVFEHVTFGYGEHAHPEATSRSAPRRAQTIAIVGQTGSGKSTLTKLVNRIYDVTERARPDRRRRRARLEPGRAALADLDHRAGYLPLLAHHRREHRLRPGPAGRPRRAVEQAAQRAQAARLHHGLQDGYETVIGERGVTLSGGQRQRLAIARALLTDPRILILDDSTSAIDSATEDEIQQAIRRLLEGRTTLLITHRLSQIRWADQILVLRRRRAGRPGHARGTAGALRPLPPHLRPLRQRAASGECVGDHGTPPVRGRPRRAERPWSAPLPRRAARQRAHDRRHRRIRRRDTPMGFIMDGLDAEAYDRTYSDRTADRGASCATSGRTRAHHAAGRGDDRARLAG